MLVFLLYLLIGMMAGFLTGLLGIGGGVIIVPALAWVFQWQGLPQEIIMQIAAASSLAAMTISSAMSVWTHHRRSIEIWPIYKQLIIGMIIGTVAGVVVAHFLKSHLLHILFGLMMLWVAATILFNFNQDPNRTWPGPLIRWIISMMIGFCGGLFGIGGGAVAIPSLDYFNVPIRNIIGITAAISFSVALIGTLAYVLVGYHLPNLPPGSVGYVYGPAVLGIIIISPLFAYIGATLSYRLPVLILRRIFAVFLILIGLKMIIG